MTFATKNLKARCVVALQLLLRYVKVCHSSYDDTWSSATNFKKYYYLFPVVAELHMSSQLRWRSLTCRDRGCSATSNTYTQSSHPLQYMDIYLVSHCLSLLNFWYSERHIKKDSTFFWPLTLKPVFWNLKQKSIPLKVLSSRNWGGSKLVSIEPQWKSVLPASVVYHAPRDTITRGALTFLAAVVLFDAIPTGWVSNHNGVGLITLQRRYYDAVAAQRRSIPKCYVKWSLWSLQRQYSDAVAL